jgi:hypothetical protein
MATAKANRLSISPEVRREIVTQVALLDALTFTTGTNVTGEEVGALRDALSTLFETILGEV